MVYVLKGKMLFTTPGLPCEKLLPGALEPGLMSSRAKRTLKGRKIVAVSGI
jgi:hypothetical protein